MTLRLSFSVKVEFAAIEREVALQQREALDGLELGQVFRVRHLISPSISWRTHALATISFGEEIATPSCCAPAPAPSRNSGTINAAMYGRRIAYDNGVQDVRARLQRVLDGRGSDQLSAAVFEQLFLAIRDNRMTVCVEPSDIAGGRPPSGEIAARVSSGSSNDPTSRTRSAHQQFAVFRNARLNAEFRPADRPDVVLSRQIRAAITGDSRSAHSPDSAGPP